MAPVQLLIIGQGSPEPGLAAALDGLRHGDAVRLLDYQALRKDADGDVILLPPGDLLLPPSPADGAMVRALLGTGGQVPDPRRYLADGDWYWFLDDQVPPLTTVLLVLVEHRWAAPLAGALTSGGGATLRYDAWVHSGDLRRTKTTPNG